MSEKYTPYSASGNQSSCRVSVAGQTPLRSVAALASPAVVAVPPVEVAVAAVVAVVVSLEASLSSPQAVTAAPRPSAMRRARGREGRCTGVLAFTQWVWGGVQTG